MGLVYNQAKFQNRDRNCAKSMKMTSIDVERLQIYFYHTAMYSITHLTSDGNFVDVLPL